MDLIDRKAAVSAISDLILLKLNGARMPTWDEVYHAIDDISAVPAVPLDKLCELLAEMFHCPSSGWPSSGHACHPGCPDEAFEKLCGTDCESYSDEERWRAFLTKWMEGLKHG